MLPWFLWKGIDSRTMGLWVTQIPAPTRPAERIKEVEIPGRAGTLTLKEGDNVHEAYVRECVITVLSDADFHSLANWLSGEGDAIFCNETDRVYKAHIAGEVKFDRISNSLKQATIPFYVHPHKGQYPPESDITLEESGTIYNPGNVESRPTFSLTFTTACTVAVGDKVMAFYHEGSTTEETIVVDCDAELVTQNGELWGGKVYGEFLRIVPGSNAVTLAIPETYDSTKTYHENDLCINTTSPYYLNLRVPLGEGTEGTKWLRIGDATEVSFDIDSVVITPRWRWC